MHSSLRRTCLMVLLLSPLSVFGVSNEPDTGGATSPVESEEPAPLSPSEQAGQILNRLSFGARPGELDALTEKGWQTWLEAQLDPQSVDDSALDEIMKLKYPSLALTIEETWAQYWPPPPPGFDELPLDQRNEFFAMQNQLRERLQRELQESVLVRALLSKRQFQEVIVEFWRNHFNIDQTKGNCRYFSNNYESSVIRQHAFGRFEEMLLASAKHPAMSIYLDNEISQKPLTKRERETIEQARKVRRENPDAKIGEYAMNLERYSGLNENYARELLELHTLGADNYYTQADVRELARSLTGWTHGWRGEAYQSPYGFLFRHDVHDAGGKKVLGRKVSGKTEKNGTDLILSVARHKGTAQFVSWKLCRYLVNDEPPKKLVDDVAAVFKKSRGNLPDVYRALVFHPLFLNRVNFRAKFKSPFEAMVSALRATEAKVTSAEQLLYLLHRMGQPLYRCEDPTGYFDQTEAWLDPGVLVHRWDFALKLSGGQLDGVEIPESFFESLDPLPRDERRAAMIKRIFPDGIDDATKAALGKAWSLRRLLGLLLGSPSFQVQ